MQWLLEYSSGYYTGINDCGCGKMLAMQDIEAMRLILGVTVVELDLELMSHSKKDQGSIGVSMFSLFLSGFFPGPPSSSQFP